MRVYDISTGKLYDDTPRGLKFLARGSSGFEQAANDPTMCSVEDVGPLPPGAYAVGDQYDDPGGLGPGVMRLTPLGATDMHGRKPLTFRIHGGKRAGPAESSHGCLIFEPADRKAIAAGSRLLLAVSSLSSADFDQKSEKAF